MHCGGTIPSPLRPHVSQVGVSARSRGRGGEDRRMDAGALLQEPESRIERHHTTIPSHADAHAIAETETETEAETETETETETQYLMFRESLWT